jgi:hypothetical protein
MSEILQKGFLVVVGVISFIILLVIYKKSYSFFHRWRDKEYSVIEKLHDQGTMGIDKFLTALIASTIFTGICAFGLLIGISLLHTKIFGTSLLPNETKINQSAVTSTNKAIENIEKLPAESDKTSVIEKNQEDARAKVDQNADNSKEGQGLKPIDKKSEE